uniref:PhoH-like protein n=1 Tax=Paulinella chromatophora TaxID=39717 RepID=B1X3Q6_PAUCH|nr:PhoH-like phosphate starvation-inducible protein [Paulinella chromatophora]ACB42575.1 PhoH-like phosphate starvation-inducible protein [Paulinella chromatophora]
MNETTSSKKLFIIDLPNQSAVLSLIGPSEIIRHQLQALTGVTLVLRGLQLLVKGHPAQLERTVALVELLRPLWEEGQPISMIDIKIALSSIDKGSSLEHESFSRQILARSQTGRLLRPRTIRQKAYVDAMECNEITLALGPAGTGKTFLAIILAVRMLSERKVERLILTRPAVEAGEHLGFLPGDLQQKIDPYLRPLYDSLHILLGLEKTSIMLEKGVIEVAPLAYMRGRTLADAFVILDEAQNTTITQMRMALTRLGENSRMVVTGDLTQIDLPSGELSGLAEASEVLKGIKGIHISHLTTVDVVRHPLVQKLAQAYTSYDQSNR